MSGRIRIERIYAYPPQKVWLALTTREALADWFMPNDFSPELGHRFQFKTDPAPGFDGIVDCEILEIEAPHRLRFSWKGGPLNTEVSFELSEHPRGCRLLMTQTGFRGLKQRLIGMMLKSGGRTIYGKNLPRALASFDSEDTYHGRPQTEIRVCHKPKNQMLAKLINRL